PNYHDLDTITLKVNTRTSVTSTFETRVQPRFNHKTAYLCCWVFIQVIQTYYIVFAPIIISNCIFRMQPFILLKGLKYRMPIITF
uniref:Uncharacterized protein n=1 Tax=Ciona intestinalis TaxID=7719 RepID=H2XLC4_CIOIN